MKISTVAVIERQPTESAWEFGSRITHRIESLEKNGWELVSVSPTQKHDYQTLVILHFSKETAA